MEGKGNYFIILLVIIAFLSLTLAALTVYVFISADNPKPPSVEVTHKQAEKRPNDDELAMKKLFESKKIFNLKGDDTKLSVIQLNAEIVYFKKVKGIKEVEKKLLTYEGEIKEIVGTYFQNKSIEDVKAADSKEKAKDELKKRINELLMSNEKNPEQIIYTINFDDWFYQ